MMQKDNTKDTLENQEVRTRFAPSPTGYMHIGGMRTALYAYCFAKKHGGKFLLRIEDTDLARQVDNAEEIIYRSLKDAGLDWDEGPDIGGPYAPYIQSQRKDTYAPFAQQLVDSGHAYYCFCTKERLQQMHDNGATKYDKHCLSIDKEIAKQRAKTESCVIRLNVPLEGTSSYTDLVFGEIKVDNCEMEDNILIKSDGMPTYNFANVIDDHLMKITHVIRGTEYLSSTPKYNLIYDALGWKRPQYIHTQPIMKDATSKLSKRKGDPSYEDYLEQGYVKQAIINYIALLGWSSKDDTEKFTLQELVEKFDVKGLSKSQSIFDINKMKWLNSVYIQELSPQKFARLVKPFLQKAQSTWGLDGINLDALTPNLQKRCQTFADVDDLCAFLKVENYANYDLTQLFSAKQKIDKNVCLDLLPKLIELLKSNATLSPSNTDLHLGLNTLAQSLNTKPAQLMWILRVAISGASVTPCGATEMVEILGLQLSIERLQQTQKRLESFEC